MASAADQTGPIDDAGREMIRVPYGQAVYGEPEIEAVVDAMRVSTQMGHHVRSFEARVAELFAKRHGIMVNSGSSANYLAVEILGLEPGSEVVTPALTFATTLAPIIQHDLTPVVIDVTEGTYNIDVSLIEDVITPRTRAVMIPSLIGILPDWDAIAEIATRHDLMVIEDSADTLGATLRGESTGTRSDISTTSFYGSHVINCAGNGGMLCVNDDEIARRATLLRSWGRSSSVFVESERIENRFDVEVDGVPYDSKFVFETLGYNMEPSEIGAAFGLVQLDRLQGNIDLRINHVRRHVEFFSEYEDWFILPRELEEVRTGWLAFPLTIRAGAPFSRRDLQIFLERRNIQTRTVFTGNALRQPAFAGINRREHPAGFPEADKVMQGGVLLGCHHGLTEAQIGHLYTSFEEFAAAYR